MFWKIIGFLMILGIGVPILRLVYVGFTDSNNGSMVNWTTQNVTIVSDFEMAYWRLLPILAALIVLGFLIIYISGFFHRRHDEDEYIDRGYGDRFR